MLEPEDMELETKDMVVGSLVILVSDPVPTGLFGLGLGTGA